MNRNRIALVLTTAALTVSGLFVVADPVTASAPAAPRPGGTPAGMDRIHELMTDGNAGMQRMHELMTDSDPGVQRMHELMTDSATRSDS